jgi:imidazolonepropionase
MSGIVYRKISCLVTNEGVSRKAGVRPLETDLGLISDAALVFDPKVGVLWVGKDKELPKSFKAKAWKHFDCNGLTAYPGLVDAHTHPVFAGDRSVEFELRMKGASYKEIAAAGGGILTSVKATRAASTPVLTKLLEQRTREAYGFGVRLMEAKSGYGLDFVSELRSLQVIKSVNAKAKKSQIKNKGKARENLSTVSTAPLQLIPTCMAAHAIPPELKEKRGDYLALVREKILPEVKKKKLAEYVDVFCDEGFFSVDESLELIHIAHKLGFRTRVHGEELGLTGIARKAAEAGVHSVDHLLKVDDAGIRALAKCGTVAVLLPGTALYLREPPAPARRLIDQGTVVALASDFNPGTSPTQNLPFIGTLAAITLGMSTAEIIAGLTWSAARSLRRETQFGTLMVGAKCGPVFAQGDHPSALFYRMAPSLLPDPTSSTR